MGFKLIRSETIADINSIGHIYRHVNGANLIFIQNQDKNKVFSVAFKTPVENDSGVAHIVEHTLFCGSAKYPAKDPFNELAKSSLNTYLNALTFRDKTVYPVASCNDKDFHNLMEVYLDAVFEPLIHERKQVFLQEGIHYEIAEGKLTGFGGIVYNEMKGVYSETSEYLMLGMYKNLFPDTQNRFDAGGVPESIADLTYDDFLAFYEQHYRPDNCYFYLYGDLDIAKELVYIESYINKPQANKNVANATKITVQQPVGQARFNGEYAQRPGELGYTSIAYVMERADTEKSEQGLWLLYYYLLCMPSSPLRKALMDAKIARETENVLNLDLCQPVLSIILKNSAAEAPELKRLVDECLTDIVENGIDTELMDACFNKIEFGLREGNYGRRPKGLSYNLDILKSWLYGGDPFLRLRWKKGFAELKADTGYFAELVREQLLGSRHYCLGRLSPAPNYSDFEQKKLDELNARLDVNALALAAKDKRLLDEYGTQEDSDDSLERIPRLRLEDIGDEPEEIPVAEAEAGGVKVLHINDGESNGIFYLQLIFSTEAVEKRLLPYLGIMDYLMMKLDTKNYGLSKLTSAIGRNLGGMFSSFRVFCNVKSGEYAPKFSLHAKGFDADSIKAFEYAEEVLLNTVYDDKDTVHTLLSEYMSRLEKSFVSSGQGLALSQIDCFYNESARYDALASGMGLYRFLKILLDDFDSDFPVFKRDICETAKSVFRRENLVASVACGSQSFPQVLENIEGFAERLPEGVGRKAGISFKPPLKSVGYATKSRVQYVAKGIDYRLRLRYNGAMIVMAALLDKEYLMREVRLKAGAYGGHCVLTRRGLMYLYSYRDPQLENTLAVYDGAAAYLKNIILNERELQRIIIGIVNRYIKPKLLPEKVEFAVTAYFNNVTYMDMLTEFREILAVKPEDLKKLAGDLDALINDGAICVVGNSEKVYAQKGIFDEIIEI